MADTCKSCKAPIIWAKTAAGKAMPLDSASVLVAEIHDGQIVRMVRGHVSHFATCANANQHRRSNG